MKILMFNYEYPPLGGGGGVFNEQLAGELAQQGHVVTVITSNVDAQLQQDRLNGVDVIRVPICMRSDQNAASLASMLSYFPSSLIMGYLHLRQMSYDLIHTYFAIPSGPSAMLLAKYFQLPHMLSILGGDIYDPSKRLSPHQTPLLRQSVKAFMEHSDLVIALSSDIKSRAAQHYSPSKPIDVIHLGIPKPAFAPSSKATFGYTEQDIVLVTVGRLVRRKGLKSLIGIFKRLKNRKLKLCIIGDGPEKPALIRQTIDLGLEHQVKFFGYVSDDVKFQLLNISDVYVSTSEHEGFGIVFLEAMATGLPVVCYDKGGQTDFLLNDKTGYLIEYGNADSFFARLQQVTDFPELRDRFKEFNKDYVKTFFIESCANRYVNAYKKMLKNKDNPTI